VFTAVVVACLGLTQRGEAVVFWEVSEVGGDVTIVASGTLDLPSGGFPVDDSNSTDFDRGFVTEGGNIFNRGANWERWGFGDWGFVVDFNDVIESAVNYSSLGPTPSITSFGGDTIGGLANGDVFLGEGVYIGTATTVSLSNVFLTVNDVSIADLFGSNLDSGPIVIWRLVETGDSIQIRLAAVPEPSSTALLGLGGLALMLRRRR
jgi:hypothetical protein